MNFSDTNLFHQHTQPVYDKQNEEAEETPIIQKS